MLPLILFILFLFVIEIYSYFGLKVGLKLQPIIINSIYIISIGSTIVGLLLMQIHLNGSFENIPLYVNLFLGMAFSFIAAKLLASTIFLIEDMFRGFIWLFQSAIKFRLAEWIPRTHLSASIAGILFICSVLIVNYGVIFGRYQFNTHYVKLEFDNLPKEFDGFKIAQISDLHLGTFDQKRRVKEGLNQLQKENPDVILFTGDMVNNKADEALSYIDLFKNLKAPYGKYSILGNHDYGDYVNWKSQQAQEENLEELKQIQQQMEFRLLLNEHVTIKKNNDSIFIAGVENWGTPPFPQYGDLDKSINGLKSDDFIVLMSHDPTHWRHKVITDSTQVELTLSGHTHGMQFGFEIGNFRWSPVKYRYPDWADLFTKNGRKLYINRGFGCIGYPGRIGIRPEITIIELKCNK